MNESFVRSSWIPSAHVSDVTQSALDAISFPEPANFLRRMLDENEGSGKDRFLGDPDWLSEM